MIDKVRVDLSKKMPPLETYDGPSDPYDHTHTFDCLMCYYGHSDAARCQDIYYHIEEGDSIMDDIITTQFY